MMENRQAGQNISKLISGVKTPDDGYKALALAVIADACEEWRKARRTGDIYGMMRVERFFKSGLFVVYSGGISGDYILRRLKEEKIKHV